MAVVKWLSNENSQEYEWNIVIENKQTHEHENLKKIILDDFVVSNLHRN